jgi:hydrogenase expression/formation protein HypE
MQKEESTFTLACPAPMKDREKILLAHGSGGKFTSQLIEEVFLPAFGAPSEMLHDGAFLKISNASLAFTTDSFVVRPLFFPGGNIGPDFDS